NDLDKVKKRIVEYMAVRKLKNDKKGPILCVAGPPGVGKTSLGGSVARAIGRKFGRISLGGVRDEAEIRGHRRTYVGSLPGRIIQGIQKAGTNNPVFVLDEIDKLGHDFRGDPASALLEVLDPEQNNTFSDHYLEVTFDLSKVLFIATANQLDPIPWALRDRLETIELPGYTRQEKKHIARKFPVPKQPDDHGLTAERREIVDEAVGEDIQFMEASSMPGKGKVTLAGQLGDEMKAAVTAVLSFVRGRAAQLGRDPGNFLENVDLHVHVPAGAVPKDGPSAGVTMYT